MQTINNKGGPGSRISCNCFSFKSMYVFILDCILKHFNLLTLIKVLTGQWRK